MLSAFRTAREAYLADLRISKSQKTYEQYELVLSKFGEWLEQTYAEQTQEQITPLTITAWKQSVAERGVKQNTISIILQYSNRSFVGQSQIGFIANSP